MSRATPKTVLIATGDQTPFVLTIKPEDTYAQIYTRLVDMGYPEPNLFFNGEHVLMAADISNWEYSEQPINLDHIPSGSTLTLKYARPHDYQSLVLEERELNQTIKMLVDQHQEILKQLDHETDSIIRAQLRSQDKEFKQLLGDLNRTRDNVRVQLGRRGRR